MSRCQLKCVPTSLLLCLFILFFSAEVLATNSLKGLRLLIQKEGVRFVLDSTQPLHYKTMSFKKPDRFIIDLANTKLSPHFKKTNVSNEFIRNFRIGQQKNGSLRLVFDLKKTSPVHTYRLPPSGKLGHRLIVEFGIPITPSNLPIAIPKPSHWNFAHKENSLKKTVKLKPKVTTPHYQSMRDIMVVIDPGHGGKDPGAIGPHGYKEKNITLAIGKHLAKLINQQPGFRAQLTRSGDYYITLRQRLNIARKARADMFISIHADAFNNPQSHGASVFALSQRGATNEAARWLAQKENISESLGEEKLAGKDYLLSSVLINLSQNHTIAESLKLGENLLQKLKSFTKLHHDHVEQAAFVVLKSPDVPSLLIETGFLSNHAEERKLSSVQYQKKMAYALMLGIKHYFLNNPPPGTHLRASRK